MADVLPATAAASPTSTRPLPRYFGVWQVRLAYSGSAAPTGTEPLAVSGDRAMWLEVAPGSPAPDSFSQGGCGVVFNGILFNRDELSAQLRPRRAAPAGDAELILAAHRRWGEGMLRHLKGVFALCLWDGQSLFCARDRVGMVPLFWLERGPAMLLSTTTEALITLSEKAIPLNRELLAGTLARLRPQLDETYFEGIRRVPPGHFMAVEDGSRRVERYWRPPPPGHGAEWVEEDELGRFGELLDQAVSRALTQGPAAIFLSGGLDSVSVAAAAVDTSRREGAALPTALSLLFPGSVSEEPIQRGVAQRLGMEWTSRAFDAAVAPNGLLRSALDLSSTWAAPLQNVWTPAYHRLAEASRQQGAKVLLTGGGGDEWLTVTPLFAADLIRGLRPLELIDYGRVLQRSLSLPAAPLWRNVLWTNGLRPVLTEQYRRLHRTVAPGLWQAKIEASITAAASRIPGWLAPDQDLAARLRSHAQDAARQRAAEQRPGQGGYYFGEMMTSLNHPLFALDVEEIFESGRRLGMMQFDVYWDADLIEFLYRVPPRLLNRNGRSKGLVREDLERRLPGFGFAQQRKLLARDFFTETLKSQAEPAWRAFGGVPALAELGVLEPRGAERHFREVLAASDGRRVDDLWHILSLESWARPRV